MSERFTWIPIYQELAKELANWQDRQEELITFLEGLRANDYVITPFMDRDESGERFPLTEIDPFTFFGVFNRGIKKEQRIAILAEMKKFFSLSSALPVDFDGIPILNNMSSWFISFRGKRKENDTAKLWRVFRLALEEDPLKNQEFIKAFDDALTVRRTNINLTIGLFWIRPDTFLNLDSTNRAYLGISFKAGVFNATYYAEVTEKVRAQGKPFPQISVEAWEAGGQEEDTPTRTPPIPNADGEEINYWMVGAYWNDRDPANQTARFLEEGIWENGYDNKYGDEVNSMKVGDKIAIKAAATQRKGLPFDNKNMTISRMIIKAVGTIVSNRKDGKTIEVEWDQNFQEKDWYFYTSRNTLWHLRMDKEYRMLDLSEKLRDFVWYGKPQDYDWWVKRWGIFEETRKNNDKDIEAGNPPYDLDDLIASGAFLTEIEIVQILDRLRSKKAMILQGPPGVGKTFIAQKLAYALMEEIDKTRLEMVQFHQSYSYDDFVRGYRPLEGKPGTFGLQNGVFYEFCQKAINDPEREYVFIIDEINRGNLSQIFGELLTLIEHDKRGPDFSVPLVYRTQPNERFYVPSNLFLIGLMNVADRSLAMVDYALRRRFAFINLQPQYESEIFRKWLENKSMDTRLIQLIVERMSALNKIIREDPLLGENYQVGHSFFCPKGDSFSGLDQNWYRGIVRTEIIPLLKEYWFDNSKKSEDAERGLLA